MFNFLKIKALLFNSGVTVGKDNKVIERTYEDNHLRLTISNGVLYLTYKGPLEIKKHHPYEFRKKRLEFLEGAILPTLVQVENQLSLTREARQAIRDAEFKNTQTNKIAFVLKSPLHRLIANLYLRIVAPNDKFKIFNDEAVALTWLKKTTS